MKPMKRTAFVVAAIFGAASAVGSVALRADDNDDNDRGPRRVSARLRGAEETPAVSSTGHGTFRATIDAAAGTIEYTLTYADLEGTTVVQAHVHLGQKTANGGVMFFLCGGPKPACPAAPATVTGTVVAADILGPAGQGIAAGEFAEVVKALRSGLSYANVHTDKHPGGEIRGQVN
jgi:hypothetical protein